MTLEDENNYKLKNSKIFTYSFLKTDENGKKIVDLNKINLYLNEKQNENSKTL